MRGCNFLGILLELCKERKSVAKWAQRLPGWCWPEHCTRVPRDIRRQEETRGDNSDGWEHQEKTTKRRRGDTLSVNYTSNNYRCGCNYFAQHWEIRCYHTLSSWMCHWSSCACVRAFKVLHAGHVAAMASYHFKATLPMNEI